MLASDLETVLVDSLKALDPNRPIREADMVQHGGNVRFVQILLQKVVAAVLGQ